MSTDLIDRLEKWIALKRKQVRVDDLKSDLNDAIAEIKVLRRILNMGRQQVQME